MLCNSVLSKYLMAALIAPVFPDNRGLSTAKEWALMKVGHLGMNLAQKSSTLNMSTATLMWVDLFIEDQSMIKSSYLVSTPKIDKDSDLQCRAKNFGLTFKENFF